MIEHRDENYWRSEIFKYDKKISEIIDNNINRVEISENILIGLRDFVTSVECFIAKIVNNKKYLNRYVEIDSANNYCKSNSNLNFLSEFYDNLNASVGHQTFIGEYAERLSIKYIHKLIEIKIFLDNQYNIKVLNNISMYPFDLDDSFQKYYKNISEFLNREDIFFQNGEKGTYYIQKKKMIYINNKLFYEYVFTNALDQNSKFDRFIVFSLINIPTNYAIQAYLVKKELNIFNQTIFYDVVTHFDIAIRPCEIEKLSTIVNVATKYTSRSQDYRRLMDYLKKYNTNLTDIVNLDENDYLLFYDTVFLRNDTILSKIINESRRFIKNSITGKNTLMYLLFKMNNDVLKKQMSCSDDDSLSRINLKKGVYAFEKSPFSSALIEHIPSFKDLIKIFPYKEHAPEILARTVSNLSNETSCIYIPKEKISSQSIDNLIEQYNVQFDKPKPSLIKRMIKQFGKYVYLFENEIDTIELIKYIEKYVNLENFPFYSNYVNSKINELNLTFDDRIKEKALRNLFSEKSIFAVYGAAGTGKSFFASYVLKVLGDINKICIASTNPAVDNMRRKFNDNSAQYMTITKYLKKFNCHSEIDILIIDECSTISTQDACKIFRQINPKLILLLGDIFQIQSITFGNWFALIRNFMNKNCYIDLEEQFRTESETLIDFWKEVRSIGPNIQEKLAINEISHIFDDSIFNKVYEEEIILCLNYDGLYGINNLNKVLQNANPNPSYTWKQYTFKENDPIIFIDNLKYNGVFYNNLKGKILKVEETQKGCYFTVLIKKALNPLNCRMCNVDIISIEEKTSVVGFEFNKFGDDVYDSDTGYSNAIPFQIAYALSIHKAQGLEYDSVKVLISNEVEENISHNIFYTAITRARKNLTIYWTPETEKKVVSSFKLLNYGTDTSILKQRIKLLNEKDN